MSVKLKRTDNEVVDSSGYAIPLVSDTENVWIDAETFKEEVRGGFYTVNSQEELDALGISASGVIFLNGLNSADLTNAPARALYFLKGTYTINNLGRNQSLYSFQGYPVTINEFNGTTIYDGNITMLGSSDVVINISDPLNSGSLNVFGKITCNELKANCSSPNFFSLRFYDNNINDFRAGTYALTTSIINFFSCRIGTLIGSLSCPEVEIRNSTIAESKFTQNTINGKNVPINTSNLISENDDTTLFTIDKTAL